MSNGDLDFWVNYIGFRFVGAMIVLSIVGAIVLTLVEVL